MEHAEVSCGRVWDKAGDRRRECGLDWPLTCGKAIHCLWMKKRLRNGVYFMTLGRASVVSVPPVIEIRRSSRRRRTVSAHREGDHFVVLVPARMSAAHVAQYAEELVGRLEARERRAVPSDDELMRRATGLSRRWLPGAPQPSSVRWVTNQNQRWGSCTPIDRTIRLSHRLRGMPAFVVDYVLLHELAHLLVPGHGADFEALLAPYPRLREAQAFLDGVDFTLAHGHEMGALTESTDEASVGELTPPVDVSPPGMLF